MSSEKIIRIDKIFWELLQEENRLLKEKLAIQVRLTDCLFQLNKVYRDIDERKNEFFNNGIPLIIKN